MGASRTRRRRSPARRTGSAQRVPGWLVFLAGIVLGLLLAVTAYMAGWAPQPPGQPDGTSAQSSSRPPVIEDVSEELKTSRKRKYDFYTVLPEMEVVIDKDEITPAAEREPARYILQVGSFKNRADAESLKAQLALLGQQARIQTLEVNQTRWHRVRVGPFDSARKADSIKRQLRKNGIEALMMKEK